MLFGDMGKMAEENNQAQESKPKTLISRLKAKLLLQEVNLCKIGGIAGKAEINMSWGWEGTQRLLDSIKNGRVKYKDGSIYRITNIIYIGDVPVRELNNVNLTFRQYLTLGRPKTLEIEFIRKIRAGER